MKTAILNPDSSLMKFFKSLKLGIKQTLGSYKAKDYIKPISRSPHQQPLRNFHPARNDLYHWLLIISWFQFLALVTIFYLALNTLFALAYLSTGNGIANAQPGVFKDVFFFSIQTLSTVGYGAMYPQTLYAQIIVTIEVLVGLMLLAILTGLMFARFSRPTARVMFTRVAVICPFNGLPTLMFRAANQRENRILEAQVQVSLVRNETSTEGHHLRRFYDLSLLRSRTPVFGLSWLVMHPIDEASPLYGVNLDALAKAEGELWITITGLDETFSQTIHARHSYTCSEILWNRRFADIFAKTAGGQWYIDYRLFHDVL
jgi:inward rectifier potassium channel